MIAIKFDQNGKAVAWKNPCADLRELRPSAEGFKLYPWNGNDMDITYLIEKDGKLKVDEESKAADRKKAEDAIKIAEIKAQLTELDMDINACQDGGIKSKTEAEFRASRMKLRNELRVLLGKQPIAAQREKE